MSGDRNMRDGEPMPVEIMARREDWSEGISIYMRERTVDNGAFAVATITMVRHEPGAFVEPMLRLGIQRAQQLMDELWQCGLRPSEGSGSAGSLAATERHLKDMQAIAVGLLRKSGVEVDK